MRFHRTQYFAKALNVDLRTTCLHPSKAPGHRIAFERNLQTAANLLFLAIESIISAGYKAKYFDIPMVTWEEEYERACHVYLLGTLRRDRAIQCHPYL